MYIRKRPLRTCSVPGPYQLRIKVLLYGDTTEMGRKKSAIDTAQIRSRYGPDTELAYLCFPNNSFVPLKEKRQQFQPITLQCKKVRLFIIVFFSIYKATGTHAVAVRGYCEALGETVIYFRLFSWEPTVLKALIWFTKQI